VPLVFPGNLRFRELRPGKWKRYFVYPDIARTIEPLYAPADPSLDGRCNFIGNFLAFAVNGAKFAFEMRNNPRNALCTSVRAYARTRGVSASRSGAERQRSIIGDRLIAIGKKLAAYAATRRVKYLYSYIARTDARFNDRAVA